jgi:pimeloyl-ACP methyl ester carboxylesterase
MRSNRPRATPIAVALGVAALAMLAPDTSGALTSDPEGLPRKGITGEHKDESYPGVVVRYDSIRDAKGQRLRLIVTHPQTEGARFPTVFVVGWLSCDSVEAPPGTMDATQLVMQSIARLKGFATIRMDKPGVGDSEGDCAATDFVTELDDYRQALRASRQYAFVDTGRIFLLGISNGGGFAPLVAEGSAIRGYVVDGGWIKTWYEHMLEIERRRLVLAGTNVSEVNVLMKSVAQLYSAYLLDRQAPAEIFARQPELQRLWQGDSAHQYGRPVAYYQQLQDLNLMAAWSQVKVPVLVLHGEFDWIMSRDDLEILASGVNRNVAGAAQFVELPHTGHTFEHYPSMQAAFSGDVQPFDPAVARRITGWFEKHR